MNKNTTRSLLLLLLSTTVAQTTMTTAAFAQEQAAYIPAQLQQLVAPIALYPDDLLGEILMASSYPYEVSMAAQWRDANPGISGDYLTAAVEQQPWDPSVKGLTEFPQVLQMMNRNLDWTEKLGEAFLDDQPDVMAAVQQLRRAAMASGALASGQQLTVADQGGYITIEPTQAADVYVPYYNPATVYGQWQYPDYEPYTFAAPDGAVYAGGGYFSYYTPIVVVPTLWGWDRWDWREHRIHFDPHVWSNLDNGHAPPPHDNWQFAPEHRRDVPFKNVNARNHFENPPPVTANPYRGYRENVPYDNIPIVQQQHQTQQQAQRQQAQQQQQEREQQSRQAEQQRQQEFARQQQQRAERPAPIPPLFESFDRGAAARNESARGNQSAQHAAPAPQPARPAAPPSPPAHNNPPNNPQKDR